MADYQLGVIGCGNMAEALLGGVIGGNFLPHNAVVASDPVFKQRKHFTRRFGITTTEDNRTSAACPRVVLAVKPQVLPAVLEEIAPAVDEQAVIISIAAGVTSEFIDSRLGGKGRIVRVMPNTPMLVGAGLAAVAAGPRAVAEDTKWVEKMLSTCAKTVAVDEKLMDAVTAVSGSGPAYFFYLIEAVITAAVKEGLDEDVVRMLAVETCTGALKMLAETDEPPEGLRARVTSPGGTTEKAIQILDEAGVKDTFVKAIRAAAQRSRELGK